MIYKQSNYDHRLYGKICTQQYLFQPAKLMVGTPSWDASDAPCDIEDLTKDFCSFAHMYSVLPLCWVINIGTCCTCLSTTVYGCFMSHDILPALDCTLQNSSSSTACVYAASCHENYPIWGQSCHTVNNTAPDWPTNQEPSDLSANHRLWLVNRLNPRYYGWL